MELALDRTLADRHHIEGGTEGEDQWDAMSGGPAKSMKSIGGASIVSMGESSQGAPGSVDSLQAVEDELNALLNDEPSPSKVRKEQEAASRGVNVGMAAGHHNSERVGSNPGSLPASMQGSRRSSAMSEHEIMALRHQDAVHHLNEKAGVSMTPPPVESYGGGNSANSAYLAQMMNTANIDGGFNSKSSGGLESIDFQEGSASMLASQNNRMSPQFLSSVNNEGSSLQTMQLSGHSVNPEQKKIFKGVQAWDGTAQGPVSTAQLMSGKFKANVQAAPLLSGSLVQDIERLKLELQKQGFKGPPGLPKGPPLSIQRPNGAPLSIDKGMPISPISIQSPHLTTGPLLSLGTEFPVVGLPAASTRSTAAHQRAIKEQGKKKELEALEAKKSEDGTSKVGIDVECGQGLRMVVGHVSQRNVTPEEPFSKPNQDAFCIETELNGVVDTHLFAVFDGHGKDGHLCAQYARAELPEAIRKSAHFGDNLGKAFSGACKQVNLEMHREPSVPDVRSGTTCIAVTTRGREMVVANVGDSRAILARRSEDGSVKALDLSQDQTPFREDERERCMQCGAEVLTLDELEGNCDLLDPSEWDCSDPPRLWVPCTGYPGTAFTRSLGDSLAETIGVYAEPELLRREISNEDDFAVICSDGVTEFISSQEVVDMVIKHAGPERDPIKAARAIADESVKLWLESDDHTDDITIIITFFYPSKLGQQGPTSLSISPTSPTSPSPASPKSPGVADPIAGEAYSSVTGDWFDADLMKAAMGP